MTVLQRIIMFICGVCFTWLMLTGFLWILGEGMYWAVRNGSGAGALVIIGNTIAGLLVFIGIITSGYALFGDYDKPKDSALSPEESQAFSDGYRLGIEEAAQKAAELLVFADTTSRADKEIPAAIRALNPEPDLEEA